MPVFGSMLSNVTVQREGTAFLHCPVKNPGDRPVSYPLVSNTPAPTINLRSEYVLSMFNLITKNILDYKADVCRLSDSPLPLIHSRFPLKPL